MLFNEGKISQLTNNIITVFEKNRLIRISSRENLYKQIKNELLKLLSIDEEINARVESKIEQMSKSPVKGSQDYQLLFNDFFEKEWKKIT